jgi:hypothetical protein
MTRSTPGLAPPDATNEARAFGIVRLSWLTRIRDCDARVAQNSLVIKVVQTGCLGGLKVDPGLASQGRVDDAPLQVVVRLKPDAQCLDRSCVEIS